MKASDRVIKEPIALMLMPIYLIAMGVGLVVAVWEKGYRRTRREARGQDQFRTMLDKDPLEPAR